MYPSLLTFTIRQEVYHCGRGRQEQRSVATVIVITRRWISLDYALRSRTEGH